VTKGGLNSGRYTTEEKIGEIIVKFIDSKQKELPAVFPFGSKETMLASRKLMYDLYS